MAIKFLNTVQVDTDVLYVDTANNRVGIGTTSPASKLHVADGTGAGLEVIPQTSNDRVTLLSYDRNTSTYQTLDTDSSDVHFNINGSEKMRLDSSGNVGIGTTLPNAKIESYVSNNFSKTYNDFSGDALYIQTNGTVADGEYTAGISFSRTAANNARVAGIAGVQEGTDADKTGLVFFTHPSTGTTDALQESLRISANGKVGIGTNSPDTKLDIEDSNPFVTIQGSSSSYVNAGVQFISNHESTARGLGNFYYSAHSDVEWFSGLPYNNNDAFVINRNESYTVPSSQSSPPGIGASAGTLLEVSSTGAIQFNNYSGTNKTGTPTYILGTDASGNVVKVLGGDIPGGGGTVTGTGTTNRLTKFTDGANGVIGDSGISDSSNALAITINGNEEVGIGQPTPFRKLHVNSGTTNVVARFESTDTTAAIEFKDNNGSAEIGGTGDNLVFFPAGAERMRIDSAGSLLINKTSSTGDILQVQGNNNVFASRFDGSTTVGQSYGLRVRAGTNSSDISFLVENTSSTDLFVVKGDGNVGIGTTSPSAPLDVFGVRAGRDWAINNRAVIRLDSNGTSEPSDILFGHTAAANQTGWTGAYWSLSSRGSSASNKFYFYRASGNPTGGSEQVLMTFDPNLKVGIGTTDPTNGKLVIDSAANQIAIETGTSGDGRLNIGHFSNGTFIGTYGDDGGVADIIRFGTHSGDERMRITSSGNVGIGTTSPSSRLQVSGDAYVTGQFGQGVTIANKLTNYGAEFRTYNASAQIFFGRDGGSAGTGAIGADATYVMRVWKSDFSQPFVIKQSGEVGIGTTSPVRRLTVDSGNASDIVNFQNNNGSITLGQTSNLSSIDLATSNAFRIRQGSTVPFFIKSDGKVGIGTTNPGAKLHVSSSVFPQVRINDDSSFGESGIRFRSSNTSNVDLHGDIFIDGTGEETGRMGFRIPYNDTEKLTILHNGNVGIGTTSPGAKLHIDVISEDNQPAFKITKVSDSGENAMEVHHGTSSALRGIADFTNDNGSVMFLRGDGNVGIGTTSPDNILHVRASDTGYASQVGADTMLILETTNVSNSLQFSSTTSGNQYVMFGDDDPNAGWIAYAHSDNSLNFRTAGSERMRIDSSGNVGIGETNPEQKLHVSHSDSNNGLLLENTNNVNNYQILQNIRENEGLIWQRWISGSFNSNLMTLDYDGNVGIGTTSPGAKLDVQPTAANRKVTRISNDVMSTYFYNSPVDAVLAWTCGSYHQAEVVITASQTNGGTTNNLYIRGIWSNNHTSHHWDELEHIGSLTGSTFTMSVGQNGSTTNSGRLELDFNYISGSFSQLNVRVTDFFGTHSYTIT